MEINGVVDKNIICEAIDECGNVNSYLKEAHDSLVHFFEFFDKCTVIRRRTRFTSNCSFEF